MMKTILNFSKPFVLLLVLFASNNLLAQTPLTGTYSIDPSGNGDYLSFTLAVADLDTFGVSAAVIFEAVNGTYNEQIELGSIAGVDSINTVTFRSQSGNAASVVVSYAATSTTNNYVVNFNGASYITIENLTMQALDAAYARVLTTSTTGGNNHISINTCVLEGMPTTSVNYDLSVTYIYGPSNDNWLITNSTFLNGTYGLFIFGPLTPKNDSNTIVNNSFLNQYDRGVYLYGQKELNFTGNYITSNSTSSTTIAVLFARSKGGKINDNYIKGTSVWPRFGILLDRVSGYWSTLLSVRNNRVYLPFNNAWYGIYSYNGLLIDYSNNSLFMSSTLASSRTLFLDAGGYSLVFNNVIKHTGPGTGVYLYGNPVYLMDYNNLSVPNGTTGFKGVSFTTLQNWQLGTAFDSNSYDVNNVFTDVMTLKVCTDSLYQKGGMTSLMTPILTDFEGEPRQNPPCIGADEFMPIAEFGFDDQTLCNSDTLTLTQNYFDTVIWNMIDTSISISVSSVGTQTLQVFGACGSGVDIFNVVVQQMVSITDTNLCEGTSATLETGISNATYLWNDGSTDSTFTVDSAQIVWVSVLDTAGCSSSDTATITQSTNVNLPDSATFCEGGSVVLDAIIPGSYFWSTGETTQVVSISSTGMVSVSVTDQNCLSSDSTYVDEILTPVASFIDSSDHLTVVFTNNSQNANSFLWCFGDGTSSTVKHPTHLYPWDPSRGCYIVSLIASNVCASDTFINTSVRVDGDCTSTTSIKINKNNWTVSFSLDNASPNNPHFWDFGDGTTSNQSNPVHTYSSSNPYECYSVKLVYTDCAILEFEKDIAVGNYPSSNPCNVIDGIQNTQIASSSIDIYPNPNKGVFNIKIEQAATGNLNMEVIDATGRVQLRKDFGTIQGDFLQEINLNDAAAGIYFVRVILNNESAVYRMVVE